MNMNCDSSSDFNVSLPCAFRKLVIPFVCFKGLYYTVWSNVSKLLSGIFGIGHLAVAQSWEEFFFWGISTACPPPNATGVPSTLTIQSGPVGIGKTVPAEGLKVKENAFRQTRFELLF